MSKWLKGKEEMFNKFKEEKQQEKEKQPAGPRRQDIVFPTPEKGTTEKPKTYVFRFIPDKNGNFYKTFLYHMFQTNDQKWVFVLCPKTWDFDNPCPLCSATMKLFTGSKEDKKSAYNYKRKRKHCGNVDVVDDPRDAERNEDDKLNGSVLVYEFPDKVESKLKQQILDEKHGLGMSIFDPGEDGFDFLLRVGATKPIQEEGPNKGKSFPDYSDSEFARKPYALADSDEKIQAILDSAHDLNAYLKSMERDFEEVKEIMKKEMIWDMVKSDFESAPAKPETKKEALDQMDDLPYDGDSGSKKEESEQSNVEESKEESKAEAESSEDDDDLSAEDLLKELDGM